MTPEEFLKSLAKVRIDRSHGSRAPHKPLLLLIALARMRADPNARLISYREADVRFRGLWRDFGRPRGDPRVNYPFGRLRNDQGLWEIPEESRLSTTRTDDILVSEAKELEIRAGFPEELHSLLVRHPHLVHTAADQLLHGHFPPSLHQDILDAVVLTPVKHPFHERSMPQQGLKVREYAPRPSQFRRLVLAAYGERCAVCAQDIRFRDRPLGLEAAHIKWRSHSGKDEVKNGLALCSLHHKALDYGALGLEKKRRGYRVLISPRVSGRNPSAKRLLDFAGRPIRRPESGCDPPDAKSVDWHRNEVFHDGAPAPINQ